MNAPRAFYETRGPDALGVRQLHRAPDGFIAFMRRDRPEDGDLRNLFSIKADDLGSMFPQIQEQLIRDSFFSVNGFYRKGTRRSVDLRYLNAAFVDLDLDGRVTVGQAVGLLWDLSLQGQIPTPSIIARSSSEGLWLFWLLISAQGSSQPIRAWPGAVIRWRSVQAAVLETFRRLAPDLGADDQAADSARVTRVPGSIHSGDGSRVAYSVQFDERGRIPFYTLEDLAGHFEAKTPERALPWLTGDRESAREQAPGRRRGWIALHRGTAEEVVTLSAHRNGYPEGMRARAVWVLACELTWLHRPGRQGRKKPAELAPADREKIRAAVLELAASCRPPLPAREAERQADKAMSQPYRLGRGKIAGWLKVTAAEADRLTLRKIGPEPADSPPPPPTSKGPRAKQAEERRRILTQAIDAGRLKIGEGTRAGKRCAKGTDRARELLAEAGIKISKPTVSRDILALVDAGEHTRQRSLFERE